MYLFFKISDLNGYDVHYALFLYCDPLVNESGPTRIGQYVNIVNIYKYVSYKNIIILIKFTVLITWVQIIKAEVTINEALFSCLDFKLRLELQI